MGLILRTTTTPNAGNSLSIKGSSLTYAEGDGNFMYLLTNLSGSTISITGSTGIIGNFQASGGTIKFPNISNSTSTNLIFFNSSTGQLYYDTTEIPFRKKHQKSSWVNNIFL